MYHSYRVFPVVLYNLWVGIDESDCPLPCETFSTEIKRTIPAKKQDSTAFEINLEENVEVKSEMNVFFYKNVHYQFMHAGDYNPCYKTKFVQFFVRCKY